MRYNNPTPVQLGMTGEFVGKRYRVAGRTVLSMEEAGGKYYWNEFFLICDDGSEATLVYEETDKGPEWRLFTLLDPALPMSIAEAAGKRVGDKIPFEGRNLRITCVDESRVCHIEGKAPEGVETGDIAHYFNAESGNEMIVVSWTGDELETYRGLTLPGHAVTRAFGISAVPSGALNHLSSVPDDSGKKIKGWTILILLVAGIGIFFYVRSNRSQSPGVRKLPRAQLAVGSTGQLNAVPYRIRGRAEVEVAGVGQRYLRREYFAADESATNALTWGGTETLLWQGTEQGADKWMVLTPYIPAQPLSPQAAGALRLGDNFVADDAPLRVTQHFFSRVRNAEGGTPYSAGSEFYGFVARGPQATVVARWNDAAITFYRVLSPSPDNPAKTFRQR